MLSGTTFDPIASNRFSMVWAKGCESGAEGDLTHECKQSGCCAEEEHSFHWASFDFPPVDFLIYVGRKNG
jgi:hypothetical protein